MTCISFRIINLYFINDLIWHENVKWTLVESDMFVYGLFFWSKVCDLSRAVLRHYTNKEVDWNSIHDAGCTCDNTDLPHHVSNDKEIENMMNVYFRSFLESLPSPPTIVTISRSSQDDYCPPEQVESIQSSVIEELKRVFEIDQPILQYLMDDDKL